MCACGECPTCQRLGVTKPKQGRPEVIELRLGDGYRAGWEVLIDCLRAAKERTGYEMVFGSVIDQIRAQLKPEEPLGLGAVVKCDPGIYERAWAVRVWAGDDFGGKAWDFYDSSGNGGRCHYEDLKAVEVLSEGITQ